MRGASEASAAAIVVRAGSGFPGNGKICEIQIVHRLGIADYGSNCLTPESGFDFGKYRLVGKSPNHAIAVLAWYIFCGKEANDPRMCRHETVEVAEAEAGSRVWTSNRFDDEGARRNFVGAKNLHATDFAFAVEPLEPFSDSVPGIWRDFWTVASSGIEHGGNNFAIAGAAAEHATECIDDFVLRRCRVFLEQSGGRDQHPRCACAALCCAVAQERLLQAIADRGAGCEPLHGRDFVSFNLPHGYQTGTNWLAIYQDGACATVAGIASDFGPGQPDMLAQNLRKPLHGRNDRGDNSAIDGECE